MCSAFSSPSLPKLLCTLLLLLLLLPSFSNLLQLLLLLLPPIKLLHLLPCSFRTLPSFFGAAYFLFRFFQFAATTAVLLLSGLLPPLSTYVCQSLSDLLLVLPPLWSARSPLLQPGSTFAAAHARSFPVSRCLTATIHAVCSLALLVEVTPPSLLLAGRPRLFWVWCCHCPVAGQMPLSAVALPLPTLQRRAVSLLFPCTHPTVLAKTLDIFVKLFW